MMGRRAVRQTVAVLLSVAEGTRFLVFVRFVHLPFPVFPYFCRRKKNTTEKEMKMITENANVICEPDG